MAAPTPAGRPVKRSALGARRPRGRLRSGTRWGVVGGLEWTPRCASGGYGRTRPKGPGAHTDAGAHRLLWEDGGGLEPPREWVAGRVALRRYLEGPEDAHASGRALYVHVDARDRVIAISLDFEIPRCGLREGLRLALGG